MSEFNWNRFPVTAHFAEPTVITGQVVGLGEQKTSVGPVPRLWIKQADGKTVVVTAAQARLLAELVDKAPCVGDMIKITYTGEAAKAAPGMSPAKEFVVAVRRKSRAGERSEAREAPENGPQPGQVAS